MELVPSVKQAFGDFFPDAQDVLASARTQVIVDDGRRFLKRTNQKFDVITLDPPPPVETSGSGLLYSKEFYESAKQRLSDHGVLQQWFPGGTESTTRAVTQTIADSFPYVRAFASLEGWGVHFLASRHPITLPTPREFAERLPPAARADLAEWSDLAPQAMMRTMTRNEFVIRNILRDNQGYYISDDRPMNEYYLMRRTWGRLRD